MFRIESTLCLTPPDADCIPWQIQMAQSLVAVQPEKREKTKDKSLVSDHRDVLASVRWEFWTHLNYGYPKSCSSYANPKRSNCHHSRSNEEPHDHPTYCELPAASYNPRLQCHEKPWIFFSFIQYELDDGSVATSAGLPKLNMAMPRPAFDRMVTELSKIRGFFKLHLQWERIKCNEMTKKLRYWEGEGTKIS